MVGGWGRLGCQSGSYCRNPGGRAGCWNPREQQRRREPVKSQTELPASYCSPQRLPGGRQRPDTGPNTCKASSTMDCTAAHVQSAATPLPHLKSTLSAVGSVLAASTLLLGPWLWVPPPLGRRSSCSFPNPPAANLTGNPGHLCGPPGDGPSPAPRVPPHGRARPLK